MKAHIGADADSGLLHSLHTSAANPGDLAHAHQLLHGQESGVFLGAGYSGVDKRREIVQAQVEHPFHALKNLFRYTKVRYKGLTKNKVQL